MSSDAPTADFNESMAVALDAALEALRAGTPFDRSDLLQRYPALADALDTLEKMLAPSLSLACPAAIGRYRIERQLGTGGFGVVYLAFDPEVRRHVAIKVLHPERLGQPEAVSRFLREARAIGRLRHSGIVQLFDTSPEGPPFYLITEYVEGVEPREWCRRREASPTQIAELLARIADAVEYAHSQGICHRDLKPGNLLIEESGAPHVLDFGLARLEANEAVTLTAQTVEGQVLGSLPYMSPEQISGRSHVADARSDVYSLGVVLYELLTGRLPFQGPMHSLPARVLDEAPSSPTSHNPAVSADLAAICLKAISKRPQDRYDSAAALASDLRAFVTGHPVSARHLGTFTRLRRFLDRRHLDLLRRGWPPLLFLLGVTILTGCVLCNRWEMTLSATSAWWAILGTKAAQVTLMLILAVRLRPPPEGESRAMTVAERQIWSLVPGYYGAFLTLFLLNRLLPEPVPIAPILSLLSGMAFANLGAAVWGWFYIWGIGFFLLSGLIVVAAPYGLTLLGLGWFITLGLGAIHMQWSR